MKKENKKKKEQDITTATNLTKELSRLRRQLHTGDLEWSDVAVSHLLNQLDAQAKDDVLSEEIDMLSLVVDSILHGEDIAESSPEFYQRMVANEALSQFVAEVTAVMKDTTPLPPLPAANLSFLTTNISKPPAIQQPESSSWEAVWRVLPAMLNQHLTPTLAAYRTGQSLLDTENTLLLFNEFAAGKQTWKVTLEALVQPDTPGEIELFLGVFTKEESQPTLQATVHWGTYQETVVLDSFGRAYFTPISVDLLLDHTGTTVVQALNLTLHQADR